MDAGPFTPAGCSFILPQKTPGQLQAELKMKAHLSGVGAGQPQVGCRGEPGRLLAAARSKADSSPRCDRLTG